MCSAGFTYRLYRLKPRASRSKGGSNKLVCIVNGRIWSFRLNFVKNLCLNYYSRNLVLFNFRGDNARVFQRVTINLNMTVGQAACQLLCRYTQSTLTGSCVCWIVPIVTCGSVQRIVAVHIWDAPDHWHNWRVAGVRSAPLTKINVIAGPLSSLYFGIYCSFGFSRLLFFLRFSECLLMISGFV